MPYYTTEQYQKFNGSKGTKGGYPLTQLRSIIKDYMEENEIKIELKKPISKMNRDEIIDIFEKLRYPIEKLPDKKSTTRDILQKEFKVKKFDDKDEKQKDIPKILDQLNPLVAQDLYHDKKKHEKSLKQYEEHEELRKKNPKIKEMVKPVEGEKNSYTKLQKHQENFLKHFILANFSGAILFHGVGTGKTLTASATANYYLSLYPKNRVVVVTPASVLLQFIYGLIQWGVEVRDNRYSFFTFEKFLRDTSRKDSLDSFKNALIIIDEAHNLRTRIGYPAKQINAEGEVKKKIKSEDITQNKRGYWTVEACRHCHKALLLTGTPFINDPYDIENLLAMVSHELPKPKSEFDEIIQSQSLRHDYLKYKVSYYMNPPNSKDFPEIRYPKGQFVPIVMSETEEKKYNEIENMPKTRSNKKDDEAKEEQPDEDKPDPKSQAFYSGVRQQSDLIGDLKVKYIVETIKENGGKSIIYTTFISSSLSPLQRALDREGITYKTISGKESAEKKSMARQLYNSDKIDVLFISKAGTEGVDTKATRNIFIVEGAMWNEALVQQAIARAVRYKSHDALPEKDRYVNVYRLILCKRKDIPFLSKINEGLVTNFSDQLDKMKEKNKKIKELLHQQDEIDELNHMTKEEKKKAWASGVVRFDSQSVQKALQKAFSEKPAIEVYLIVMSLAKQYKIDEIIMDIEKREPKDKHVLKIEDYDISPLEKATEEGLKKGKSIIQIQRAELQRQKDKFFASINDAKSALYKKLEEFQMKSDMMLERIKSFKGLNEFFTPPKVIIKFFAFWRIKSDKIKSIIETPQEMLEPTAGIGNLAQAVADMKKPIHINMVEFKKENRKVLEFFQYKAPDVFNLYEENDFMKFINPIQYDYVVMNPPFDLKGQNLHDTDFIQRAYNMLKNEGELVAIMDANHINTDEATKKNKKFVDFTKWVEDNGGSYQIHEKTKWEATGDKKNAINKLDIAFLYMQRPKANMKDPNVKNRKLDTLKTSEEKKELKEAVENFEPIEVDKHMKPKELFEKYNPVVSKKKTSKSKQPYIPEDDELKHTQKQEDIVDKVVEKNKLTEFIEPEESIAQRIKKRRKADGENKMKDLEQIEKETREKLSKMPTDEIVNNLFNLRAQMRRRR